MRQWWGIAACLLMLVGSISAQKALVTDDQNHNGCLIGVYTVVYDHGQAPVTNVFANKLVDELTALVKKEKTSRDFGWVIAIFADATGNTSFALRVCHQEPAPRANLLRNTDQLGVSSEFDPKDVAAGLIDSLKGEQERILSNSPSQVRLAQQPQRRRPILPKRP